ncbi:DUF4269 domain-containing protein [Alkalihalobacillus trypoxylicola]|uniref:Uncharacterized protein n=1 Tax=Alkalihalobacillus trypoxylicola TaxID=519424 RepID=A0A161P7G2_9BACI|nr:DUF4269 domain-containing protein [Alkalihalobacillus trypoxylicola]KYG27021.1 hypothetical protein AZF04_11845 [Alkalihalobacillus trypoxylicola]
MFEEIHYLKKGTAKQRKAYLTLQQIRIMEELAHYTPLLCGTIPIGIDLLDADLDIIVEVHLFHIFESEVKKLYGHLDTFKINKGRDYMTVSFYYNGFMIEIFAQNKAVKEQNAYLHMIIEWCLIEKWPFLKEEVIDLKKKGLKTEPAFCKLLNLKGDDPYLMLLEYGEKLDIISKQ